MAEMILVVDDETEIAELVEVYLKNEGYLVKKASCAAEALHIADTQPIALALLDVMLPDLDGFTLCRKIREKHLFPLIMLTAKTEDVDKIVKKASSVIEWQFVPGGASEEKFKNAILETDEAGKSYLAQH